MSDDDGVPWRAFLAETERRLADAGLETAAHDARRLVEEASGHEGSDLYLGLDEPATTRGVAHLDAMVERRVAGEPLQYVLGAWSFRTLDLMVDRRVLIPRPETEVVAGHALAELDRLAADRRAGTGATDPLVAVDLGTGSGAIGLALAAERPGTRVWLTDASPDALAVARSNLAGIGRSATHVTLAEGSWFEALPHELRGAVDVVVSNPPYVGAGEVLPLSVADWEPAGALVSGTTGREALDHLVRTARSWLAPGGALVVELAPDQASAVADDARAQGYVEVEVHPDLTGRDRLVVARVSP